MITRIGGTFDSDVLTSKELTGVSLSFLTRRYANVFFLCEEHQWRIAFVAGNIDKNLS